MPLSRIQVVDSKTLKKAIEAGGLVNVPAGRFVMNQRIKSKAPIVLVGAGPDLTEIVWTNANGGIVIESTSPRNTVTVKDLTLKTSRKSGGTALKIVFPKSPSSVWNSVNVGNVEIAGKNFAKDSWDIGVQLVNCWNSLISRTVVLSSYKVPSQIGFLLEGVCTETTFSDCRTSNTDVGFKILGDSEGVTYRDCTQVGGRVGVEALNNSDIIPPFLKVRGCHFNVREAGIRISSRSQSFITENLIYRLNKEAGVGGETDFVGIQVVNKCRDINIINNQVIDPFNGGKQSVGIKVDQVLEPTNGVVVALNAVTSVDVGVWIANGASVSRYQNTFNNVVQNVSRS